MNNVIMAIAALTLLLTGCGADEKTPVVVKGKLAIAGELAIPTDASAQVRLSEQGAQGSEHRIVAEQTLHELGTRPIGFNLRIARNLLDPQASYNLSAEITTQDNKVLWKTAQPHTIKPLTHSEPIKLAMSDSTAHDLDAHLQQYRCADGFTLAASPQAEQAIVRLGNRRLEFARQARTAVFVDDHDNRLETVRDTLDVVIDGAEHRQCQPVNAADAVEDTKTVPDESPASVDDSPTKSVR